LINCSNCANLPLVSVAHQTGVAPDGSLSVPVKKNSRRPADAGSDDSAPAPLGIAVTVAPQNPLAWNNCRVYGDDTVIRR